MRMKKSSAFSVSPVAIGALVAVIAAVVVFVVMYRVEKFAASASTVSGSGTMRKISTDPKQSFIQDLPYTQYEYVSDPNWIDKCKKKCESDRGCYGFFEQTHKCPEPNASDGTTDPNNAATPNKGCYRICGFYTQPLPKQVSLVSGGLDGSVWEKK